MWLWEAELMEQMHEDKGEKYMDRTSAHRH